MVSRNESPSSGFHATNDKDSNNNTGKLSDVQEQERRGDLQ